MANASALLALSSVDDSAARQAAARRSSCCASVSGGSGGDGGTAGGGMRGLVVVVSVELPSSSGDGQGATATAQVAAAGAIARAASVTSLPLLPMHVWHFVAAVRRCRPARRCHCRRFMPFSVGRGHRQARRLEYGLCFYSQQAWVLGSVAIS